MQELSQLQTVVGNTDVILSMDNHRDLNMDGIIEEVRREYEGISHRSAAEVDAMYRGRVSGHQGNRNTDLLIGKETKNVLCLFPSVPGPAEHVGKSTRAAAEQSPGNPGTCQADPKTPTRN